MGDDPTNRRTGRQANEEAEQRAAAQARLAREQRLRTIEERLKNDPRPLVDVLGSFEVVDLLRYVSYKLRNSAERLARGASSLLRGWRWLAWLLMALAFAARDERAPLWALAFQIALVIVGVYGLLQSRGERADALGVAIAAGALFAAVALLVPFQDAPRYLSGGTGR